MLIFDKHFMHTLFQSEKNSYIKILFNNFKIYQWQRSATVFFCCFSYRKRELVHVIVRKALY